MMFFRQRLRRSFVSLDVFLLEQICMPYPSTLQPEVGSFWCLKNLNGSQARYMAIPGYPKALPGLNLLAPHNVVWWILLIDVELMLKVVR